MILDTISIDNIRMKIIYDNVDYNTIFNSIVPESNKLVLYFYKNLTTHELFLLGKYSGTGTSTFTVNDLPAGASILKTDGGYTIDGDNVTFQKTSGSDGFIIGNMSKNGNLSYSMSNSTVSDVYIVDVYDQSHYSMNNKYFEMGFYNNNNSIILLPEPSIYDSPINVTGVINDGVSSFVYTDDGTAPTVAKYIAYDSASNPFIAVVQDNVGGNVAFDGGFPKFYNSHTGDWSTFAELNPQCKYLHNALKWISNDKKVDLGNNKLLVLCDQVEGGSYSLDYGSTGFKKTMDVVCTVAGLTPDYRSVNSFGSIIDFDSTFLDQYCGMIMWSTNYLTNPNITTQAEEALLNFRVLGNGMMFITDHGDAAQYNYLDRGFYRTANQILRHYNAFFHGNVNRSSVNVGYLRTNYGDHPLYDGLLDSEYISAGGSESNVVVQSLPEYTSVPTLNFSVDGFTTIKILAILDDGNITYETYSYGLNVSEPFVLVDPTTGLEHDTNPTLLNYARVDVLPNVIDYPVLKGDLKIGSNKIGDVDFSYDQSSDSMSYYKFNDNVLVPALSRMGLTITEPVSYTKNISINRQRIDVSNDISLARFNQSINQLELSEYSDMERIGRLETRLGEVEQLSYARKKRSVERYMADQTIYGFPSVLSTSEGQPVDGYFSNFLSNNTGYGLNKGNITNTHNCTVVVDGDKVTITPTGLAYEPCGIEFEFYDENGIVQSDSVFVKVTPSDDITGFVFNTENDLLDHRVRLYHIIENYNLALLREPSVTEVVGWYNNYVANGWTRQQLDDAMEANAIANSETWNTDRQFGIDSFGDTSYPRLLVSKDETQHYINYPNNSYLSSGYTPTSSHKITNPITNRGYYVGNKWIMYNLYPESETIDIQQNESLVINVADLLSNDTVANEFYGLGNKVGCTVDYDGNGLLTVTPTVRKGELCYFEYQIRNVFGDIANATTNINVTELNQTTAIAFMDTYRVDLYKESVQPPDANTVLAEWPRSNANTFYSDPSTATGESADWYVDGAGNFVQPNNSSTWLQILSPTKEGDYDFEVTLQSSSTDDDSIGIVLASDFIDGTMYSIVANIHTKGNPSLPRYCITAVQGSTALGTSLVGNDTLASRSGWSNAYIRLKAEKRANTIKVWRSNWNSELIIDTTELSIDLSSVFEGKLVGESRYGYSTFSQADSKYKNIEFYSDVSYDVTKIGDLTLDQEYKFVTGSWTTLANTMRQTYDYPRKVRNPFSNDVFYLDFNTVSLVSRNNTFTTPSIDMVVGENRTIDLDTEILPLYSRPTTLVEVISNTPNISMVVNPDNTIDISANSSGVAYIGIQVEDDQGYRTFDRIAINVS